MPRSVTRQTKKEPNMVMARIGHLIGALNFFLLLPVLPFLALFLIGHRLKQFAFPDPNRAGHRTDSTPSDTDHH